MQIYKILCELMINIDCASKLFYSQNYFEGSKVSENIISTLTKLLSQMRNCTFCEIVSAKLPYLLKYQENGDYTGVADFYVMHLKPACQMFIDELRNDGIWQEVKDFYESNFRSADEKIRKMLCDIDAETEDIPDGYELVETGVGSFTLQVSADDKKLLLASACNPYDEAAVMSKAYCDKGKASYVILGLGMGYLAGELSKHEDICDIIVCEHDLYVIKAAFHYIDLRELLECNKVHIYYDPSLSIFTRNIAGSEDKGVIIHRPSMMNIRDLRIREKVQDFFIHDSSVRNQGKKLYGNFYMNTAKTAMKNVCSAKELKNVFEGRNVLFIAGGPSLEDNMPILAENSTKYIVTTYSKDGAVSSMSDEMHGCDEKLLQDNEYIVVAVGTVLKRLLGIGVIPDYVVMSDPQQNMMSQIAGVDTSKLSLIYLPTLYHGVVSAWEGPKYMALQKDFKTSELMAKDNDDILFETGGSVATLALDIAIRFLSRRIVCMGLDLAYVDNKRHVGETKLDSYVTEGLRKVKGVSGQELLTSVNLDNYRLWIERRIDRRSEKESESELINVSRGAFINGMLNDCSYLSSSKN